MASQDYTQSTGHFDRTNNEEQAFQEEMKMQFKLFMNSHFGDPACEVCLETFPE